MALGAPVAGAVAYSAAAGTSVAPAYPASIAATDAVLLIVGQKPSTANGGTVTTPSGWTLRGSLTAAGGYGTTLGADTGNTNLRIYSWDTPVAGQTGNLTVTIGTNNVSWAFMVRIPSGGGTLSYGSATGSRTTAPTAGTPFSVALTNGSPTTAFTTGDVALWAMCIPTDVTTPGQFATQDITATGAVFGTPVELNEPDSGTGNDIGGYSAWDNVDSGTSSTAPTVTVTATGTVTNVRGPIVLVRVREAQAISFDAQDAAFTITGQAATLTQTYSFNAEAGSFAVTGQDADLTKTAAARELDAQPGSFSITGQAAQAAITRSVNAQAGSFSITGQAATLTATRSVNAQAGSFAITGQASSLQATRSLNAQAGSFSITGQAATLVNAQSLNAQPGSFSITGQAASFSTSVGFTPDAGSFVITGQAATFTRTRALDSQPGSFTITGEAAELARTRVFDAQPGSITISGQDATFARSRSFDAQAGSFTITGQDASFGGLPTLDAQPGSFTIAGQDASLLRTRQFSADAGAFGPSPYVDPGYADPGYFGTTGAQFYRTLVRQAGFGVFTITGQAATMGVSQLYPSPSDVRAGVVYGPDGMFVGTYVAGGGRPIYVFDD